MKKIKITIFVLFLSVLQLSAQNFKFAVMTDSRGDVNGVNVPVLKKLTHHLLTNNPDLKFILFLGDLIDGSWKDSKINYSQMLFWKKTMAEAYESKSLVGKKVYVCIGNHEVRTPYDEKNFLKVFPDMPKNGPADEKGLTYSFDYDNAHFVIFDSDRWYYGDTTTVKDDHVDWHKFHHPEWLENDLRKARKRGIKKIFVGSHEMFFPIGGHLRDGLANLGKHFTYPPDSTAKAHLKAHGQLWKIITDNKVTAYLSGHEHIYGREKVDGVYQIIAGSSGAPVYDFNPTFDQGDSLKTGQEFTYKQALPYYKALGYNYGPGKNSQKSEDFVGKRAYHYVVLDVKPDSVVVKTFGMKIKENSMTKTDSVITLIDQFTIK